MNREMISEVQSPCISNCCLDGDDVCLGCFRSLDEILAWTASSNTKKCEIIETAKQRSSSRKK